MEVGDFVKGKPESDDRYSCTTSKMTRGVVVAVNGAMIEVKILDHEDGITGRYRVFPRFFEVTGHVKPFDRNGVLTLLKNRLRRKNDD